jgi:ATP-binding cassette subfamily F protein 3
MGEDLAIRTDYESDSYKKLIDDLTHANERLDMMGINTYQGEIERKPF